MDSEHSAKHVGMRGYVITYLSLLALATLSWLLAVFHVPGGGPISIGIAVVKALLVLAYFMHLAEEPFSFKLTMATSVIMVMIFIGLTALDPLTRNADAPVMLNRPAPQAFNGD
jgi:caa(3)-type oxidase subunit IV